MNDKVSASPSEFMGLMRQAQDQAAVENLPMVEPLQQILELDNAQFLHALGQRVGLPVVTMAAINNMAAALDIMPFRDMLRHECLLLREEGGELLLVVSDPFDQKLRQWADANLDFEYIKCLAHRSDISAFLTRQEKGLRAMESLESQEAREVGSTSADGSVEELSFRAISEDASPVIKFVNSTIFDALRAGASDIHLESEGSGMVIKYRVDGVLSTVGSVSTSDLAEQTISRIKVMSELDISERRVPQDGRFRVSLQGRLIDLRVSIIPSIHGEDAVLRILDKQSLSDQM